MKILKDLPQVIYLQVSVLSQLNRLKGDVTRPLLLVSNQQEKLEQLQTARVAFYEQISDVMIDTNQLSIDQVADKIINFSLCHDQDTYKKS